MTIPENNRELNDENIQCIITRAIENIFTHQKHKDIPIYDCEALIEIYKN